MPFYINTNRAGIPLVESNGVEVLPDKVIIKFADHAFRHTNFLGYITVFIKVPIPADAPITVPVEFEANGETIKLTSQLDNAVYASDIGTKLTKYILLFYNKSNNTLQLM